MNLFQIYYYFSSSDRKFLQLSYNLQTLREQMNTLNTKRKELQSEVLSISSNQCAECEGRCCRGEYNHYSIVDYLIRNFSDNPLKDYGQVRRVENIFKVIIGKLKEKFKISEPANWGMDKTKKCPNLTKQGCGLAPEDRPIRCVIFTCSNFRKSLSKEDLNRSAVLIRQLHEITSRVKKI